MLMRCRLLTISAVVIASRTGASRIKWEQYPPEWALEASGYAKRFSPEEW